MKPMSREVKGGAYLAALIGTGIITFHLYQADKKGVEINYLLVTGLFGVVCLSLGVPIDEFATLTTQILKLTGKTTQEPPEGRE